MRDDLSDETLALFGAWPLLPIRGDALARVAHRGAVFVAPDEAEATMDLDRMNARGTPRPHPLTPGSVASDDDDDSFQDEAGDSQGEATEGPERDPRASDVGILVGDPSSESSPRGAAAFDFFGGAPGAAAARNDASSPSSPSSSSSDPLAAYWRRISPALVAARAPVLDARAGGPGAVEAVRSADPDPRDARLRTAADVACWKLGRCRDAFSSFAGGTTTGHAADSNASSPPNNASSTLLLPPESFTHVPPAKMDVLFDLFASQHFSSGFAATGEGVAILKSIAMFATTEGARVAIDRGEFATCPPDLAFADALRGFDGLLAHDRDRREFYAALGVAELSDADALSRFVVPNLKNMGAAGRVAALTYVERHWAKLRNDEALKDALGDAAFVETDDGDGGLARPRDVYDPEVALLARTFADAPGSFPVGRWRGDAWLTILRACGMRSSVDADVFRTCATRVAARAMRAGVAFPTPTNEGVERRYPPIPIYMGGSSVGEEENRRGGRGGVEEGLQRGTRRDENTDDVFEIMAAGSALAAHFAQHCSALYSSALCDALAGVPFVPAQFGVPGAPRVDRCNVLASYADALAPDAWATGFMARPALPEAHVPPSFARHALRLKPTPSPATVVDHLVALGAPAREGGRSRVFERWGADDPGGEGDDDDPAAAAVSVALAALAPALENGTLDDSAVARLRHSRFVPVARGALSASPARLFLRADAAFAPLALELPAALAERAATVRALGARDEATPRDAAEILRDARRRSAGKPLGPNEVRAAVALLKRATEGAEGDGYAAFATGAAGSRKDGAPIDRSRKDGPLLSDDLPAPDSRGRLVPARTLAHARGASPSLLRRLDPRKVPTAHPLLAAEAWVERAGIRAVKDAVREARWCETEAARRETSDETPPGEPLLDAFDAPAESKEDESATAPETRDSDQRLMDRDSDPQDSDLDASDSSSLPSHEGGASWPEAESFAGTLRSVAFADALARCVGVSRASAKRRLAARLRDASRRLVVVPNLRTHLVAATTAPGGATVDVTLGGPRRAYAFHCRETRRAFLSPPPVVGAPAAPLVAPAIARAAGLDDAHVPALAALLATPAEALGAVAEAIAPVGAEGGAEEDGEEGEDEDGEEGEDKDDVVGFGGDDARKRAAAEPGAVVTRADAARLRAAPLRPLTAGEIVAVRVRDGGSGSGFESETDWSETDARAKAAAAAERRAAASAEGAAAAPARPERFAYARVVEGARPAPGAAIARVTLETAPGRRESAVTADVFTFGLAAEEDDDEEEDDSREENEENEEKEEEEENEENEGDADVAATRSSSSRSRSFGPSPESLARAARDLLTAAGAPPTLEQTSMLAAHQRLRAALASTRDDAAEAEARAKRASDAASDAAKTLLCPITQTAMSDPVVALDGHTYERRAIEQWFARGRLTSPVTNLRLPSVALVPNHALKSAADALHEATEPPRRPKKDDGGAI